MPATVKSSAPPPEAVFDAEAEAWEVCERDAEGRRHGECRLYRQDGSLKLHCRYRAGVLSGPFTGYHPGGATARRGEFVAGKLHGPVTRFAGDQLGSEPLRACCVPPGATELRSSYLEGQLLRELFVDAAGRPLSSDGTPWPERAAGVPEDAEFDDNSDRWCVRGSGTAANERHTLRYYGLDGCLLEEVELAGSRRRAARRFDASGALIEEQHFDEQGAAAGRWYRRHSESPFDDPQIVAEEATMQSGSSIAESRFLDAAGAVVRVVDRGSALDEAALLASPALAEGTPEADSGLIESLVLAGRIREAICAAARRLARDHDVERFQDFLARFVVRLRPDAGALRAQAAESAETTSALIALEALLLGGDAAQVLRLLASTLPPTRGAALDLVNAALCLDPASVRTHVTRALIRLEQGDIEGALDDAEVVARESEAAAAALRELCRLQFPAFSFWPERDPVTLLPGIETIQLDQPLAAIRRVVQLYATRLSAVRAALIARVSAVPGAGEAGLVAARYVALVARRTARSDGLQCDHHRRDRRRHRNQRGRDRRARGHGRSRRAGADANGARKLGGAHLVVLGVGARPRGAARSHRAAGGVRDRGRPRHDTLLSRARPDPLGGPDFARSRRAGFRLGGRRHRRALTHADRGRGGRDPGNPRHVLLACCSSRISHPFKATCAVFELLMLLTPPTPDPGATPLPAGSAADRTGPVTAPPSRRRR